MLFINKLKQTLILSPNTGSESGLVLSFAGMFIPQGGMAMNRIEA